MTKTLDFIFDFGSPNAYLTYNTLGPLLERTGATLEITPSLLGGLFKMTGNKPPFVAFGEVPAKMAYENLEMMRFIFSVIDALPANGRLNDLEKALTGVFPSNRSERRTLIGILGFAGILVDPSKPDFRSNFVPMNEREETPWHTDDWPYPVQWWTASNGVNRAAVLEWFPEIQTD